MKYILTFLITIFSVSLVRADTYTYKILKVIDGDTVLIEAPYLPKELKHSILLRIQGVDTPEKGGKAKCNKERYDSDHAKKFVEHQIALAKEIKIEIKGWDKYGGRVLGDVLLDSVRLSKLLIDNHYAVVYDGKGIKKGWC